MLTHYSKVQIVAKYKRQKIKNYHISRKYVWLNGHRYYRYCNNSCWKCPPSGHWSVTDVLQDAHTTVLVGNQWCYSHAKLNVQHYCFSVSMLCTHDRQTRCLTVQFCHFQPGHIEHACVTSLSAVGFRNKLEHDLFLPEHMAIIYSTFMVVNQNLYYCTVFALYFWMMPVSCSWLKLQHLHFPRFATNLNC